MSYDIFQIVPPSVDGTFHRPIDHQNSVSIIELRLDDAIKHTI